jgi:hypothetical protein
MQFNSARALLLSLASLSLQGCALWGSETPLPASTKLLDAVPRVSNSPKSPCWQQREIAKQNAFFKAQETKAEVVFQAPCDVDKPPPAKVASAEAVK